MKAILLVCLLGYTQAGVLLRNAPAAYIAGGQTEVIRHQTVHQPPPHTIVKQSVHQPAPLVQEHVHIPVQKNIHLAETERVVGSTARILKPQLSFEAPGATVYNHGAPLAPSHTVIQEHRVDTPVAHITQEAVPYVAPAAHTVVEHAAPLAAAPLAAHTTVVEGAAPGVAIVDAARNVFPRLYNTGYTGLATPLGTPLATPLAAGVRTIHTGAIHTGAVHTGAVIANPGFAYAI